MTNISVKHTTLVLSLIVVAALGIGLSLGTFATTVHAQSDGTDGWGTVDTSGYGGTDGWGTVSDPCGGGCSGDTSGYYGGTDGWGTVSSDCGGTCYGGTDGWGTVSCDTCTTTGTDVYGTDVTYENGVGYLYSSYSQPFSFSAPTTYYSRPTVYSAPAQQQQQQQQGGSSQPINIVNNNNNTNNNNNNNIIPAVTTVQPIYQQPVQYPVVYQQPYVQPVQTLNCYISAAQQNVAPGQTTYLTWSAPGASSAYLSGVGAVNANGSIAVSPAVSTTYTLTVYGYNNYGYNYGYNNYGGQNTCSVFVSVAQPIYSAPAVSLSQIPYTGVDFGAFGDALYWLALLAFAASGAYLVVYYLPRQGFGKAGRGGAMTLATALIARRAAAKPVRVAQKAMNATAQAIEKNVVAPVRATLAELPVFEPATKDTMHVVRSGKEGQMPRIVITRT